MSIAIAGVIGLLIGVIAGYFFAKAQLGKTASGLQMQLEHERSLHIQTQQLLVDARAALDKITAERQYEREEKVRTQTQLEEITKQLNALGEEFRVQVMQHQQEVVHLRQELTTAVTSNADLSAKYQASLSAIEEQKRYIAEANASLKEAFNSLSSEALKSNNQSFLDLAKTSLEKHIADSKTDLEKRQQAIDLMVKPLSESLTKFDGKIQEIEKARQGAYSEIKVFLDGMKGTTEKLQKETNSLVTALKTSHVRGKYGEIGLRRVVEFAGMSEFCDFDEQASLTTEDGRLRPDLIVKLPGQRRVIIDAKVPLMAYMQAFETIDEHEKRTLLDKHAGAVREHLKKLSAKAYWSQFDDSPDYVIMYLQIESSFGAALEVDRSLIEDGMNNKVIFATPTTLISLLRTIAFSWQQVSVAQNIYQIRDAGVELYNRVTTLIQHIAAVGSNLNSAAQHYNKAVGSLESRFIPQVKKLKEIGGTLMDKDIPTLNTIETSIRPTNELPPNQDINTSEGDQG